MSSETGEFYGRSESAHRLRTDTCRLGGNLLGVPRYPEHEARYDYRCEECGEEIPPYQGLYWFTRERNRDGETADVPYCPECGSEAIRVHRN